MNIRRIFSILTLAATLSAHPGTTCAQTIFVTNFLSGTIGEYDAVTAAADKLDRQHAGFALGAAYSNRVNPIGIWGSKVAHQNAKR
jgi:hypothetical protein